jgi:Fe2+ transport system protein FeoA
MTLDAVPLDVPVRVTACTGLSAPDRDRLAGLGLRPGVSVVKLLKTPLRDPIECLVGTQLLAIEARLLHQIRVELV